MLKPCSVIYFPGFGGNFFKLCLSLSPETVPYYYQHLDSYPPDQLLSIREITAAQRRDIIRYSTREDYQKIHSAVLAEPDFYYESTLINHYFKWSIVSNHPDNYESRLPWLKKIIYVELDLDKYGHWVKNAYTYFTEFAQFGNFDQNNNYRLTETQLQEENLLKKLDMTTTVSMTNILESTDGFIDEYLKACNELEITPEIDQVTPFYQDWRSLRVDPFI